VVAGLLRLVVAEVVDGRLLIQNAASGMTESFSERLQDGQIGGTLQVQEPPPLFSHEVVGHLDALKGLSKLVTGPVVDAVGASDESDDHVPFRGFLKDDLGVARGDDLGAGFLRNPGQERVDVALTKDFEMGVGLIQQEH